MELVESFNNPSHGAFVFLLSSLAGGVGLNLIGGNRLVMFDASWNPQNDAQAIARCYRDGQRFPVTVLRLIAAGTVEEKIFQRQLRKQEVSDAVVDGPKDAGGSCGGGAGAVSKTGRRFSMDELRQLFRLRSPHDTECDTLRIMRGSGPAHARWAEFPGPHVLQGDDADLALTLARGDIAPLLDHVHIARTRPHDQEDVEGEEGDVKGGRAKEGDDELDDEEEGAPTSGAETKTKDEDEVDDDAEEADWAPKDARDDADSLRLDSDSDDE